MYLTALDNPRYIMEVDKLMRDLRGICLGYHIHIADVLPPHFASLPDRDKARQLARQLAFALKVSSDVSPEQVRRAGHWFHDIFYYLFAHCRTADQTFYYFVRIYELPRDSRYPMFQDILDHTAALRADAEPPVPTSILELAVLQLLKASNQSEKLKAPVSALYELRKRELLIR